MIRTLLAGLAIGLGGLLYWQWAGWPPPPPRAGAVAGPQTADTPTSNVSDPIADLKPLEDREEYAVVRDRPLFRPNRRPPKDEPTEVLETPPVEESGLGGFDLTGIIISPTVTTAWVNDPQQQTPVRLRPGESLAGWTVTEIRADSLVVERQGKSDTLYLRDSDSDSDAAPAPGAVPPPAAPFRPVPHSGTQPRPAVGNRPPPGGVKKPGAAPGGPPTPGPAHSSGGQPPPGTTAPLPTGARPEITSGAAKDPSARLRPPAGTPQSRSNVRPPTESPN